MKAKAMERPQHKNEMPDGWYPDLRTQLVAARLGFSLDAMHRELARFIRYHVAGPDDRFADWNAAFRFWLRTAVD